MIEITPRNARQWSRFGSRAVFGQAIFSLAETKKNLMILSADLGGSSGLKRFINSYPDKADLDITLNIINENSLFGSWVILDGYNFDIKYQNSIKK